MSADEPGVALELLEAALADAEEDDRLRIEIEWELTIAASAVGRLAASAGPMPSQRSGRLSA